MSNRVSLHDLLDARAGIVCAVGAGGKKSLMHHLARNHPGRVAVTGTVVTGAGPHAGDETARRYGFDISAVAEVHSVTVWIAVAVFLALVVMLRRTRGPSVAPPERLSDRLSWYITTWMFLAVLQGGIGYLQYFNGVPAVLVAAHVAGATALWVVTVNFLLAGLEPTDPGERRVHTPETLDEHPFSFDTPATA